jgi:hypothetical protein
VIKKDHVTITIGKKPFGEYKVISKYAYENDFCTLIQFENQEFIWIPTFPEMGEIIKALFFVENYNRINRGKPELTFIQHLEKMGIERDAFISCGTFKKVYHE